MDYIKDVLSRIKNCYCGAIFLDLTRSRTGKYCGKKCRDASDREHQRLYMRKRRKGEYLLGKPRSFTLGTFSANWLDRHIAELKKRA